MFITEELDIKLTDLKQGIAIERRHRYIDVQGRKKTFSTFITQTLKELSQWLGKLAENNPEWQKLPEQFAQYPHLDLPSRMTLIGKLETLLSEFEAPTPEYEAPTPRAKTIPTGTHDSLQTMGVQYLKGVGPRLAQLLSQLNIFSVEQLLYYFPRRYLDYQNRVKIKDLEEGQETTVLGVIHSISSYAAKGKALSIVQLVVRDETGFLNISWFYGKSSQAVLESYKSRYSKGSDVMISGKVKWDNFKKRFAMDRPQIEILSYQGEASTGEEPVSLHAGRIVPIYPLIEGLNLRFLRKAIHQALTDHLSHIRDPLPEPLKKQHQLVDLQSALYQIHFPETQAHHQAARRRLVFDELFYVQARLLFIRNQFKQTITGLSLTKKEGDLCDHFCQSLPFELTGAQKRVFQEICDDLASKEPMYRLLQGDVGSGKTVVAVLSLLIGIENGYQGALMAPTEILAEQHFQKCVSWLTPLGLKVGLFVGKTGAKEKRRLRQDLLNGQIHLAVGTHALIQEDVEFAKLGVVVIDEQHRFGVRQRTLLKSKGDHPEMLTMTATPIPRTLAMTLHGDLDVSVLDELPPGRSPIQTMLLSSSQQRKAHQLIRQEVIKGRQAYIVFPLIEESETLSAKAATSEAERLQNEVFPEYRIGLLHGKLPPEEKEAVMAAFVKQDLQILVSTTVIEVGVDVPNATVMIIESADRFGLAQLHQLRGRVGRGAHQSYCILVSDTRGEETMKRLSILTESQDGFYIAEQDLAIRGPGEFLGTRQSGLPDFILADLVQDQHILEEARQAAQWLVSDAGTGLLDEYPELKPLIFEKTDRIFSVLGSG